MLCLQNYDEKVIISGSSDSTVRVWDVKSGEMVNTLIHHCEAVLHLRFNNGMMVTCSKDRTALQFGTCSGLTSICTVFLLDIALLLTLLTSMKSTLFLLLETGQSR